MSQDFIDTWNQLLYVGGTIFRPLCTLVLGAAIGWISASSFLDDDKEWQLKIAIFLGVLGAFICLHIYSGAGTTAAFALGTGVSAIALGLRSAQTKTKK
jgi:uncharacterized membrane protein YeaQ/YmgE (transglycosylase-associated protein family)